MHVLCIFIYLQKPDFDKNILEIDNCSIVSIQISELMPRLLKEISQNEILHNKIYSIEFLV